LSFNINLYETSKDFFSKRAFGEIYNISGTSFIKVYNDNKLKMLFYHVIFSTLVPAAEHGFVQVASVVILNGCILKILVMVNLHRKQG